MQILDPRAWEYSEKYSSEEPELLRELRLLTEKEHAHAHMISGAYQGLLLRFISRMIRPRRILEIGTFTGYSALCMAEGLVDDGELHTIELRNEDAALASSFFNRSDYRHKIKLHVGDAGKIIDELDELWDLVFIDADKVNYSLYFKLVFPRLKAKGFILADNVLFHGQVLEHPVNGKNAVAIQAFNDLVLGRDDVEKIMLPVRDGLCLIQKKS